MRRFVEQADRGQSTLLPECLDDFIDENNPVRVIDVFVDTLDLGEMGFDGANPLSTLGCATSSQTGAMQAKSCAAHSRELEIGRSKSSSAPIARMASKFCREDGSLNGHSPGSVDAANWPRILKQPSPAQRHGFWSRTSEPLRAALQELDLAHAVSSPTL
jgi:hypothetical protein